MLVKSIREFIARRSNRRKTHVFGSVKLTGQKRGVIYWTKPSKLSLIFSLLAVLLIVIAIFSASVPIIPMLWYRINPSASEALTQILAKPAISFGDLLSSSGEREMETYQPPIDPNLPKRNLLRIEKIGVVTEILEQDSENYEEALQRGVWRVPDFGNPYERRYPTILVAHRFGYITWSNEYRRKNSFFNLPKLAPGDRVEIIWNQRRYTYEIYGGDEHEQVRDYTADLILYTCQFLESPVRIFRYGKLVKTL